MGYKVKVVDFASAETMTIICDILNKGNQVEIKRERENIVIVEIERHAKIKLPIQQNRNLGNKRFFINRVNYSHSL